MAKDENTVIPGDITTPDKPETSTTEEENSKLAAEAQLMSSKASKAGVTAPAEAPTRLDKFLEPSTRLRTDEFNAYNNKYKKTVQKNFDAGFIENDAMANVPANIALHVMDNVVSDFSSIDDDEDREALDIDIKQMRSDIASSSMSETDKARHERAVKLLEKAQSNNFRLIRGSSGRYWIESMTDGHKEYSMNGILEVKSVIDDYLGVKREVTPEKKIVVEPEEKKEDKTIKITPETPISRVEELEEATTNEGFLEHEKWALAALGTDLATSVAGILMKVTGVGAVPGAITSAVGGVAALGMGVRSDYLNPEVGLWEGLKNAGVRLGLETLETLGVAPVSMLGYFGKAGKYSKLAKKALHLGLLGGQVTAIQNAEFKTLIDKDMSDYDVDDWKTAAMLAQMLVGISGAAVAHKGQTKRVTDAYAKTPKAPVAPKQETLLLGPSTKATPKKLIEGKTTPKKPIEGKTTTVVPIEGKTTTVVPSTTKGRPGSNSSAGASRVAGKSVEKRISDQKTAQRLTKDPGKKALIQRRIHKLERRQANSSASRSNSALIARTNTKTSTKSTATNSKATTNSEAPVKPEGRVGGNPGKATKGVPKSETTSKKTSTETKAKLVPKKKKESPADVEADLRETFGHVSSKRMIRKGKAAAERADPGSTKSARTKSVKLEQAEERARVLGLKEKRLKERIAETGGHAGTLLKGRQKVATRQFKMATKKSNKIREAERKKPSLIDKPNFTRTERARNVASNVKALIPMHELATGPARRVAYTTNMGDQQSWAKTEELAEKIEAYGYTKEDIAAIKTKDNVTRKRRLYAILRTLRANEAKVAKDAKGTKDAKVTKYEKKSEKKSEKKRGGGSLIAKFQTGQKMPEEKAVNVDGISVENQAIIEDNVKATLQDLTDAANEAKKNVKTQAEVDAIDKRLEDARQKLLNVNPHDPRALTALKDLSKFVRLSDFFAPNNIHIADAAFNQITAPVIMSNPVSNMDGYASAMNRASHIPRTDSSDPYLQQQAQQKYYNLGLDRKDQIDDKNSAHITAARAAVLQARNATVQGATSAKNENKRTENSYIASQAQAEASALAKREADRNSKYSRIFDGLRKGGERMAVRKMQRGLREDSSKLSLAANKWSSDYAQRYIDAEDEWDKKTIKADFIEKEGYDPDTLGVEAQRKALEYKDFSDEYDIV